MAIVTKTPAVYVQEISGFANSVVEVETAVPAFIGYTEFALHGSRDVTNFPLRISSMTEFAKYFGNPPNTQFKFAKESLSGDKLSEKGPFIFSEPSTATDTPADNQYQPHKRYYLYYALRMFFDNGGGSCFIVSVGPYTSDTKIDADALKGGVDVLTAEPVSTMVVVPDAVSLSRQDFNGVAEKVLSHCKTMQSRVAILDVFAGDKRIDDEADPIGKFRDGIGTDGLDFGAAYYPWLETSVVAADDIGVHFLTQDARDQLRAALDNYSTNTFKPIKSAKNGASGSTNGVKSDDKKSGEGNADSGAQGQGAAQGEDSKGPADAQGAPDPNKKKFDDYINNLLPKSDTKSDETKTSENDAKSADASKPKTPPRTPEQQRQLDQQAHQAFFTNVPFYRPLMEALLDAANLLPPSGAMAGIYARTDLSRGVFKAPAGISVSSAVAPIAPVTFDAQQDLNMPLDGKAINAIRAIPNYGVMVWGARTLNGNSQDTRYINVRRTMIMLEQSIKNAAQAYMFEPNTATTWVSVESTIANFLTSQWKAGALFGATPAEAFSVSVGLGLTMTSDDILNGMMNVMVKVAIVRPAEFIVLTFQQTMPNG